jgi:signal transduction histidine kinase
VRRASEVRISENKVIGVVSEDSQLRHLCREALTELGRADLLLENPGPQIGVDQPDILVLDWSRELQAPEAPSENPGVRKLYVVERGPIELSLAAAPSTIGVLVKPVSRTVLKLALEQAIALSAAAPVGRLSTDPADRDDILQCLLQAYLRLQEYDYDRTNFLARAMHDFRAPLTAISGYCGLFLEGLLGGLTADQKDVLYRMQRSADRLSRLAFAVLELTLGNRAKDRLVLRPDSIENCIEQAIHEIRPRSEEKDISIILRLRDIPANLCFDADQMEQVLLNLLDNACRFTPKHGLIEIAGYPFFCERRTHRTPLYTGERRVCQNREPNSFRVDIKDSGPPVPAESIPLVFEDYIPYSSPEDRSGGGLGLAICKLIVRSHQGQIWVRSGPDGVVFSFSLPLPQRVVPDAYSSTLDRSGLFMTEVGV